MGHNADDGDARHPLQHRNARVKNCFITAKIIDDQALDPGPLLRLQQRHRPIERRKDAAPVDIRAQQDRGIRHLRHTHIDDVLLLQIDLRLDSPPPPGR